MSNMNKEYKLEITNKIIEALKKGTAPWQKPWHDDLPVNAVTGNHYHGVNSIFLAIEGSRLSEDCDPRWATKKQAESKGWLIKDGATATKIFVLILPKKIIVHSGLLGKDVIICDKKYAIRRTFEVYHASQIQGISPFVSPKRKSVMNNRELDEIIFSSSVRIFEGGTEACYLPESDLIRMPYRSAFMDTESYYSTLLHELAHWTGHSSRLDRFFSWSFNKSSEAYAREELVAEIASMFITLETGIRQTQEHFDNHVAYIDSWISLLKADPNAIFKATQEANKAVDFIMSFRDDLSER